VHLATIARYRFGELQFFFSQFSGCVRYTKPITGKETKYKYLSNKAFFRSFLLFIIFFRFCHRYQSVDASSGILFSRLRDQL
jgi:hypothetical protein